MTEVSMELEQQRSGIADANGKLFLVNYGVDVVRRGVVLAFEKKIKVRRANDVERDGAELFVGEARLCIANEKYLGELLNQARSIELVLIRRDSVQHAGRRVVGELIGQSLSQVSPKGHLLALRNHGVE